MNKRILIIDDNHRGVMLMYRQLKNYGYEEVRWARTGREGLREITAGEIHLAIILTELSDMSGYEICRKIKSDGRGGIKVILMTGLAEMMDIPKAMEAGADDYVVRTSNYMLLLNSVKKMFVPGEAGARGAL